RDNARQVTGSSPAIERISAVVSRSHSLTLRSLLPESARCPSGANTRHFTHSECPENRLSSPTALLSGGGSAGGGKAATAAAVWPSAAGAPPGSAAGAAAGVTDEAAAAGGSWSLPSSDGFLLMLPGPCAAGAGTVGGMPGVAERSSEGNCRSGLPLPSVCAPPVAPLAVGPVAAAASVTPSGCAC